MGFLGIFLPIVIVGVFLIPVFRKKESEHPYKTFFDDKDKDKT